MSIWSMMNWAAWGICIVVVVLIMTDFIKTEKARTKEK